MKTIIVNTSNFGRIKIGSTVTNGKITGVVKLKEKIKSFGFTLFTIKLECGGIIQFSKT